MSIMMNSRIEYEKHFAEFTGAIGARAFLQGRHALFILLKALGINNGDHVGVCGFTCLSVIEGVKRAGAIPVYLDVDESLCISPPSLRSLEADSLKVVILQHTFGNPGQFDELLQICKDKGWIIIEDCAHAVGCRWKGQLLGSFGTGAIYSFQWGKPYTTGLGGMLTVNSEELLQKVDERIEKFACPMSIKKDVILQIQRLFYSLAGHGKLFLVLSNIYRKLRTLGIAKGTLALDSDFSYYAGFIRQAGFLLSIAGIKKLEKWPAIEDVRRQNVKLIEQSFKVSGLPTWPVRDEANIVMLRYPVLVVDKPTVIKKARHAKIDIAGWYCTPVHPVVQSDYWKIGYKKGMCITSEDIIVKMVHLPTNKSMRENMLVKIIDILKNYIVR